MPQKPLSNTEPSPPANTRRRIDEARVSALNVEVVQPRASLRIPLPQKLHLVFARKVSQANRPKPIARLHPEAAAPSGIARPVAHPLENSGEKSPAASPVIHKAAEEPIQPVTHALSGAEELAADYLALHAEISMEQIAKQLKQSPLELTELGEKLRAAGLLLVEDDTWRPAPDFRSDHQLFIAPNRYLMSLFDRVADVKLRQSWMAALQAPSPLLPGHFGNTKTQLRRFDGKKLLWKLTLNKKSIRMEFEKVSLPTDFVATSIRPLAAHLKEPLEAIDLTPSSKKRSITFTSAPPAGLLIAVLLGFTNT